MRHPRPRDCIHVQVGHDEVLLEGFSPHDHLAGLVHDQAVPVEDQLILASDHVRIGDDHAVIPGPGGQHLLTKPALAHVEGGGVDVHDQFSASGRLSAGRSLRQPDVFTNVHPHRRTVQDHKRDAPARVKIAALIEHAIVRQIPLTIGGHQPAIGDDGRRIVQLVPAGWHDHRMVRPQLGDPALSHIPDHGRHALTMADHLLKPPGVVLEEARLQEQILRRIACDGEFGERHQVRLGPARLPQPPLHPSDIPRHVPDGGVHLDHGDTKDPHSDLSPPFPPPTRGRVREGPKKNALAPQVEQRTSLSAYQCFCE